MSNEFEQEWDDKMEAHMQTIRKGQLIAFQALAKEINDYSYTTISQVNGALAGHIERLTEIEKGEL